jgi:Zn-dependent protease with chaperone function
MPTYPEISSEAFRHPLDWEAEVALRDLPGFDALARKFVEFVYERPQAIYQMGNHILVGPRQYATLYQIFRQCVRDLDIYPEPSLFVTQQPTLNAFSLGQEHATITLNSGILDSMTQEEIRCVLAHELGHIKCGHTILIQMALWAISSATFLGEMTFGLGNVVGSGLIYSFYEWRRKAELSADRAALLVTDDLNAVMKTMMKMAGGSSKFAHEASLDEFIRQSQQYQDLDREELNQVYKFLLYNNPQGVAFSHPFTTERISYLQEWANSEEYQQIKQGNYSRCNAQGAVDVTPEAAEKSDRVKREEMRSLKRQIEELKAEIERVKSNRQQSSSDSEASSSRDSDGDADT